jgi:hypothetical protein
MKETKVSKLKRIFESNPNPPPRDLWTAENEAEFEGDGDILGGYCRREEEDCTGAAAKCCNVENVTNEMERVIGDSKAKTGQGGGCRGH